MTTSGRPAPNPAEREIQQLAALLGSVVELAGRSGIFPGDWEQIAEMAVEHASVRAAVAAQEDGS